MLYILFLLIYNYFILTLPLFFFFFNDTATTEIYTLSLHDALPILEQASSRRICHRIPGHCAKSMPRPLCSTFGETCRSAIITPSELSVRDARRTTAQRRQRSWLT